MANIGLIFVDVGFLFMLLISILTLLFVAFSYLDNVKIVIKKKCYDLNVDMFLFNKVGQIWSICMLIGFCIVCIGFLLLTFGY